MKNKSQNEIVIIIFVFLAVFFGVTYFVKEKQSPQNSTPTSKSLVPPLKVYSAPQKERIKQEDDFLAEQQEIVKLVNQIRVKNNLKGLKVNDILMTTAKKKGMFLVENNLFQHSTEKTDSKENHLVLTDKLGWTFDYYFENALKNRIDSTTARAGENIGMGYKDATEVAEAWMNSEPHKELMLDGFYTDVGIFMGEYKNGEKLFVLHLGG